MAVVVLEDWLPVECAQGRGYVFAIEFEKADNWYTILLQNRAIVTLPQEKVLTLPSYSHGRDISDDAMKAAVKKFAEKLRGDHPGRPSEEARGQGA